MAQWLKSVYCFCRELGFSGVELQPVTPVPGSTSIHMVHVNSQAYAYKCK